MSDESPLDIGGMTGPETPPPTTADLLTKKEVKETEKQSRRPSPSDRQAEANDRLIEYIQKDCERLRDSLVTLQTELNDLRPRYTALQESYRASLASNVFSIAMIASGGALISGAGYAGEGWKVVILIFGIATFLWGILLQTSSTWLAALFRPPNLTRADRSGSQSPTDTASHPSLPSD